MNPGLPHFPLHPDPRASSALVAADITCACCNQPRSWAYDGPVTGGELGEDDEVCPWCIDNGTAWRTRRLRFVEDVITIDSKGGEDPGTPDELHELFHLTPAFPTWGTPLWLSCCGHPAVYSGTPLGEDLLDAPDLDDITASIVAAGWPAFDAYDALTQAGPDEPLVVHLFSCAHCAKRCAYLDQ